jgi:hypothetical protein
MLSARRTAPVVGSTTPGTPITPITTPSIDPAGYGTHVAPSQLRLPHWLAPMIAVIPGQAAALRLGELRGVNVDRPPGGYAR